MTRTHQDARYSSTKLLKLTILCKTMASLMFSIVGIHTHLDTFKGMWNWNTKVVFHHINMHIDPLLIVNDHHLVYIQSKENRFLHIKNHLFWTRPTLTCLNPTPFTFVIPPYGESLVSHHNNIQFFYIHKPTFHYCATYYALKYNAKLFFIFIMPTWDPTQTWIWVFGILFA